MIIGPTSSALTNLVFSKKGTRVIEIIPKYKHDYEKTFKNRYSNFCPGYILKNGDLGSPPDSEINISPQKKVVFHKK